MDWRRVAFGFRKRHVSRFCVEHEILQTFLWKFEAHWQRTHSKQTHTTDTQIKSENHRWTKVFSSFKQPTSCSNWVSKSRRNLYIHVVLPWSGSPASQAANWTHHHTHCQWVRIPRLLASSNDLLSRGLPIIQTGYLLLRLIVPIANHDSRSCSRFVFDTTRPDRKNTSSRN